MSERKLRNMTTEDMEFFEYLRKAAKNKKTRKKLEQLIKNLDSKTRSSIEEDIRLINFQINLLNLSTLAKKANAFMDNVHIMHEDEVIRNNRLLLLQEVKKCFDQSGFDFDILCGLKN